MHDIRRLVPQRHIVIISPHYDDVPLMCGGYLDRLRKARRSQAKRITVINVFSRSNYQGRDERGNRTRHLKRVQFATGIRLLEDLTCLDDLLGHGAYGYELWAERECLLRSGALKPGEKFEFPQGNKSTFSAEDRKIYRRMIGRAKTLLASPDTAILLPLAIKEHMDHIIVRDAFVAAWRVMKARVQAQIYFCEDQPYAGLATVADWQVSRRFSDTLPLQALDCEVDIRRKVGLVMKHYPSQVEASYREGMLARSRALAKPHQWKGGAERLYRLKPTRSV